MSAAVLLTLITPPAHALVADAVAPDRFAALSAKEIAALPVLHGGRPAELGDFFQVRGERTAALRIEGDLGRVEGIGTAMAGGELVVAGPVGRDLGLAMAGGTIDVSGNAGDNAGGARPGAARGMTGGEIVIRGSAGTLAGAAMRRGLVMVTGDAGPGVGRGMIAGTVVVGGRTAPGTGRFLKRGSIVALGGAGARPATFRYACTYRPSYLLVLFRYLRQRYGLAIADRHITGRYARYAGDMAELGKGEILEWVAE
ncbi:MAG TPA: formylmethanofuran dehydrogenase subunit C [Gemmatimonadales bacterium]|nr:formylmethanofuran dehydrogenase subunit C [Gemmatimonadales bacterium]